MQLHRKSLQWFKHVTVIGVNAIPNNITNGKHGVGERLNLQAF